MTALLHQVSTSGIFYFLSYRMNKKHRRDSARCENGHSQSIKVIRCCANRRGILDFLLALNSNLTSIFHRSWDII